MATGIERANKRIRVGQPGSLVRPGDPVPKIDNSLHGKQFYEAGQFAPSAEYLTSLKLQEMLQAGLLPATGLDIYDKDGKISESKVKDLDTAAVMEEYSIKAHNPTLPPFALIGLVSVFHNIDREVFDYANISYLDWKSDINNNDYGNSTLAEQASLYSEMTDTADRNLLTGYGRNGLNFSLVVFQPYFVYLSVPVVPAIKNVSSGLNVSSVSTLKTLGYILFDRLRLSDKIKYVEFLDAFGWKQENSVPRSDAARYKVAGSEIGLNRGSSWYRDSGIPAVSTASTLSPKETFSELVLFYYVHRMYLAAKRPEYVSFMDSLVEYFKEM